MPDIGSLAGPAAYAIVALLAALEASAFVGLFIPGELAMLTGGYIAQQGHANLALMMALAAAGAIAGDSIGYEIGRRFGPALQRSRLGRKVGDERWERAQEYVARKGGRAVFFGRFIGVLRALVPAIAGITRMPYRRFLVWNAAGALLWAPGFVAAGYLAGSSYSRIEGYAGQAGLVLLGLIVAIGGVVVAARWVAGHPDQVRSAATRQIERPWIASGVRRYRSQIDFLIDRFRPSRALGLTLTIELVLLGLGGLAFGALLQDVVGHDGAFGIDRPVLTYLADHRTAWLTTTFRTVTWFGSTLVLVPLALVIGLWERLRTRSWATFVHLALTVAGAVAVYDSVKLLVGRARPAIGDVVSTATGYSFPSGHTTQTAAVATTLAFLVAGSTSSWARKVATWAAAGLAVVIIAFSRVYLGVHWPTDVLAGRRHRSVVVGLPRRRHARPHRGFAAQQNG